MGNHEQKFSVLLSSIRNDLAGIFFCSYEQPEKFFVDSVMVMKHPHGTSFQLHILINIMVTRNTRNLLVEPVKSNNKARLHLLQLSQYQKKRCAI